MENEVGVWLEEIKQSKKREKDYLKQGEEIVNIYEGDENTPFNILFSNTETMLPALFSNVPRPVVRRRFKDEDPLGKFASDAAQRMLEYLVDTDVDGKGTFEEAMTSATLDGLLPGRGITSIKYDAEVQEFEAEEGEEEVAPTVSNPTVYADSRFWDRVYFGYAKKWADVPWVAYEEHLTKKECEELFGEKAAKIEYTEGEDHEEDEKSENEYHGKKETALVYQIWDKDSRMLKYVSPQCPDYLKEEEDPLGLTGFFNCPKPIQFVRKTNNLTPSAPYKLYENQAKELNRIQLRLNRVIDAIKVRGAYDGSLGVELEEILKGDDNELIPSSSNGLLSDGGFDKAIWFLPIEKLVGVAQQLYQARESAKRVIYEITGISDIVRGQSMASETLGAQKIKETWGTMRLKRLQKQVQTYCLDTMRLMLEVAVQKFDEETWAKITGMPLPSGEQKQQAEQIMAMAKQGQIDPKSPEIKKAQDISALPSWDEVIGLLKDHYWRSYRLDMETNSTLDVEATEDKQQVAEFMNAYSQLLNGLFPMVEKGILPFDAAKSMMLAIVKRYRFGRDVEDQLKAMSQPKPKADPKQIQAEQKKMAQEKQNFEKEKKKAGDELDKGYNDLAMQKQAFKHDQKLAEMELKHKEEMASHSIEMEKREAQADLGEAMSKNRSDIQSILDKHKSFVEKCQMQSEM